MSRALDGHPAQAMCTSAHSRASPHTPQIWTPDHRTRSSLSRPSCVKSVDKFLPCCEKLLYSVDFLAILVFQAATNCVPTLSEDTSQKGRFRLD